MDRTKLSITTWNSRGMVSAVPYLRTLCKLSNFIMVTEHWLHDNRLRLLEQIDNEFEYFGRSSKLSSAECYGTSRGQGGVAIMWHNSFKGVTPLRDILHDRICGVRVQTVNGAVINIFCVYLPAYGCGEDYETTLDELSAILESTEDGSINIIGGDLNGDLGALGGPRSRNNANKQGKILNRFITKYDYIATNL